MLSCCDARCCDETRRTLREGASGILLPGMTNRQLAQRRGQCGVGIIFSPNIEGALAVADLVRDGPADRSGIVKAGDILRTVDDVNVYCMPAQEVQKYILGAEGTSVRLGFSIQGSGGVLQVKLTRQEHEMGPPQGMLDSGKTRLNAFSATHSLSNAARERIHNASSPVPQFVGA